MLFVSVGSGLGLHDDDNNNDDTAETQTDTLLLYKPTLFYRFSYRDYHGGDRFVVTSHHYWGLRFIHVPRKLMKKAASPTDRFLVFLLFCSY